MRRLTPYNCLAWTAAAVKALINVRLWYCVLETCVPWIFPISSLLKNVKIVCGCEQLILLLRAKNVDINPLFPLFMYKAYDIVSVLSKYYAGATTPCFLWEISLVCRH